MSHSLHENNVARTHCRAMDVADRHVSSVVVWERNLHGEFWGGE